VKRGDRDLSVNFEELTPRLKRAKCRQCGRVGTLEWQRDKEGKIREMDDEAPFIRCTSCGWGWWALVKRKRDNIAWLS